MSASAVTLIGMGKAAATPTVSGSVTSAAEAVPVGGATAAAEAAAGAGVAAEERAETGSTEEPEVRKFPTPQPITTAQGTKSRSVEILVSSSHISDAEVLQETSWV